MKKQGARKLQLSRETLHHLTETQLNVAQGGVEISGSLKCSELCTYAQISTTRAGYCTVA